MMTVTYPNSISIDGPWLIEYEKLLILDKIVDGEWNTLIEYNEKRIKEEIERQINKFYSEVENDKEKLKQKLDKEIRDSYDFSAYKSLIINFKSGSKISANSFREAVKEPAVNNELPFDFNYEIKVGEIKINISLSEYYNNKLNISITPENNPFSKDILFKLNEWAESTRSEKWIQFWKKLNGVQWILLVVIFFTAVIFVKKDFDLYKREISKESYKILNNGIDSSEINRALEIILSVETKYVPKDFVSNNLPIRYWLISMLITLIICLILSFPPESHIEVGLGKRRVKIWKIWIRIISIIIPAGIILPIAINKISGLL